MRLALLALGLAACSPTYVNDLPLAPASPILRDAAPDIVTDDSGTATGDHCGLPDDWVIGSWGDCPKKAGCSYMCIAQKDPDTGLRFRVAACVLDGHVCVGQFVADCAACP